MGAMRQSTPREDHRPSVPHPGADRPTGPVTYELASWGVRAVAFALDALVFVALGAVIGIVVSIAETDQEAAQRLAETLVLTVGVPIALLYAPLLMGRPGPRNGQTLGKQAMGIRVVREDGQPMTVGTGMLRDAFGRQLLAALSSGIYALFDYLWPLWDRNRQCLHDKIARTRVVRIEPVADADARRRVAPSQRDGAPERPAAPAPRPPQEDRPVRGRWLPPVPGG